MNPDAPRNGVDGGPGHGREDPARRAAGPFSPVSDGEGALAQEVEGDRAIGPEALPRYGLPGEPDTSVAFFIFGGLVAEGAPPAAPIPPGFFGSRSVSVFRTEIVRDPQSLSLTVEGGRVSVGAFRDLVRRNAAGADVSVALCTSAGGLPGIYAAVENGFDLIVGLSAVVAVLPGDAAGDRRTAALSAMIAALANDERLLDVRGLLESSGRTKPIRLIYPAFNAPDVRQAAVLAGHPSVETIPVPSRRHGFWAGMGLLPAMRRLFVTPPAAPCEGIDVSGRPRSEAG